MVNNEKKERDDDGDQSVNGEVRPAFYKAEPYFSSDHGRDVHQKAQIERVLC